MSERVGRDHAAGPHRGSLRRQQQRPGGSLLRRDPTYAGITERAGGSELTRAEHHKLFGDFARVAPALYEALQLAAAVRMRLGCDDLSLLASSGKDAAARR